MTSSADRLQHAQVDVEGASIHVIEAGDRDAPAFVFLHGWPQSWRSWEAILHLAGEEKHAIALDLPGIGASTGHIDGAKHVLGDRVLQLAAKMGLRDITLVGHDIGGMIVYACLRAPAHVARAVIMDVVIPGIDPWDDVLRNPHLWHFAFHAVPDLPERLVQGHQGEYFAYFYDLLAADPNKISAETRAAYSEAYASSHALRIGFDWYRAFPQDAAHNRETRTQPVTIPVLYLRGEHETGQIGNYVAGLRNAGVTDLQHHVIANAGHFAHEESPQDSWRAICEFSAKR